MGWFSIYITRYGVVRPDMGWSARKMSRIWGGPFMFRYGVVRPQNAQIWGGQVLCPDMGWSARKTLRYGVVRHRPNMGWSAHRTLGYGVVRYGVRIWGGPPTERSDMGWSDIARIWGGPPTKRSDMGWSDIARIWGGPPTKRSDMGWSVPYANASHQHHCTGPHAGALRPILYPHLAPGGNMCSWFARSH
jgi:hypothetical protein